MVHKLKKIAKMVFDTERGWFDRTQMPHQYRYDVDVKSPKAKKKIWVYWGSASSIGTAVKKVNNTRATILKDLPNAKVRVVDSATGKVVKEIKV